VTYGAEYGIKTGEDLTEEASFYNSIKSVQLSKRKSNFFQYFENSAVLYTYIKTLTSQ